MLIDLKIEGQLILLVGAGREAARKTLGLVGQDADIVVVSKNYDEKFIEWERQGEMRLIRKTLSDGTIINDFEYLYMVMALTDDRELNRSIVTAAKKKARFVYSVDDPEYSDFSNPSLVETRPPIRMAISTSGQSPLMARHLRERAEAMIDLLIRDEDYLQIELQAKMRETIRSVLPTPDLRKQFLMQILDDPAIGERLKENHFDQAEAMAMKQLKTFQLKNL
jgi:precorrin-2 dehydrogenase / sirohydrochlorin ferrochelatase